MAVVPIAAQHGGGSAKPKTLHAAPAPKTPHTTTPHSGPAAHVSSGPKAVKPMHGGGHAAVKTTTHVTSVKTTTHGAKAPKVGKASKSSSTTKTTKTTMTTTSTTPAPSATLTKVQLKLRKNTNLASKLQSRLPAGTNLTTASAGFRNLGQFVAAVNVSNNLGIPFSQLKTRMVDQGMSLGQAIQDTRPNTSGTTVAARRAEADADVMIRTTEETTASKTGKVKKSGGN